MNADELTAAMAGTKEFRDVQVRQVHNGFVFSYVRRFKDADTESERFSISSEGVAADAVQLLGSLDRFYKTGDPSGQA